jgi:hypothetical protein
MEEKYIIEIDGVQYKIDGLKFNYSQLDGDDTGRGDDASMTRDVKGLLNKVTCLFKDSEMLIGENLSKLLKLLEKKECTFSFFDAKDNSRITKHMYIVADEVEVFLLNGEFMAKEFQLRFTPMEVDSI